MRALLKLQRPGVACISFFEVRNSDVIPEQGRESFVVAAEHKSLARSQRLFSSSASLTNTISIKYVFGIQLCKLVGPIHRGTALQSLHESIRSLIARLQAPSSFEKGNMKIVKFLYDGVYCASMTGMYAIINPV